MDPWRLSRNLLGCSRPGVAPLRCSEGKPFNRVRDPRSHRHARLFLLAWKPPPMDPVPSPLPYRACRDCPAPAPFRKQRCAACALARTRQRTQASYRQRCLRGVCYRCGQGSRPGRCLCKECALLAEARRRQRYQERREQGVCPLCGEPPRPGKVLCAFCLEGRMRALYRRRDRLRAQGLCIRCGLPSPRQTQCAPCRRRKDSAALRARRIAEGNCISCKERARPGFRQCEACAVRTRQYAKRLHQLRQERLQAG